MRKIYLTETTFRNMLIEMVKEVLNEAKMSLDGIYEKYYTDIDKNIFLAAVNADPTSKRTDDGNIIGIGEYTKWILKLVRQGNWKPGDTSETTYSLTTYHKLKQQKKLPQDKTDIGQFKSVGELYNFVQEFLGNDQNQLKSRSEIKQSAEKVYEDEQWEIIIPHTEEAACLYGKGTKWCTAAKENNMFDYYNNQGPLYINIYKPTNSKYQFHFESSSFNDENDEEIQPNDLPWTEGALAYYKSINKEVYLIFDWIDNFDSNGIARVQLNDKQTWFSLEKQDYLFPNQWFDRVNDFDDNGIAMVKLNGKYTWFSLEKQDYLFPNQWFDGVDNFNDNGIAMVKLNDKYNWFSLEKQGLLFPNQWFDGVGYFNDNGIAMVKLNGKYNWFSLKKQDYLFPEQWFDGVSDFYNGSAKVLLNRKYYFLTLDGQLLDYNTKQALSQEQVQELFQQEQQIAEMVNRLVKNYLI